MIEQLQPYLIGAAMLGIAAGFPTMVRQIPAIIREVYYGRTKLLRAKRGDPQLPDIVVVSPPYIDTKRPRRSSDD